MRKQFVFFFFALGLISILAQVTILRELIVAFYGNELFVGIILGIWLLGTGSGSLLSHRLSTKLLNKKFLLSLLLISFLLFPLEIILIRLFWGVIFFSGELPSFFLSSAFIFSFLFPFCFLLGAIFTLGTSFWTKKKIYQTVSRAYLWETIGHVAAGLLFSFFLISSTFPFPKSFNNRTLKFRFPNLVESINSRYGNISITETGGQFNFYESGVFVNSSQEQEASEYFVHPILTQQENPKKILLIGGGLSGVIQEILKYRTVEKIDYVELDPKLIEAQRKYLPLRLIEVLKDPKVKINFVDGRRFLKTSIDKYDFVIFNLPNPSTALLNRFYTKECLEEAKKLLRKKGILALSLNLPVDYLSEEAINLASSINRTAQSVFSNVLILPEETSILFLASNEEFLNKPNVTIQRFKEQKIKTSFLDSNYLFYRMTSDKVKQVDKLLQKQKVKINTDFHPIAYFYENTFWQTIFSFKIAKIIGQLTKLNFFWIVAFLLIIVLGVTLRLKHRLQIAFLLTAAAGFTLMSFEILIISVFQVILGYVFSKIALIFAIILGFVGLGNFWATKSQGSPKKSLSLIAILILAFCSIFIWLVQKIPSEPIFYLLSAIIGFLTGMVFPLANKLYLRRDRKATKKTGILYTADLTGAFFGAILPSVFLIPIFGVFKTVWLLGIINALILILLQKPGR